MELPIDIIIRVDAKKENNSGEYIFQCKALGELVRCGKCKYHTKYRCPNDMMLWQHRCELGNGTSDDDYYCADGERMGESND